MGFKKSKPSGGRWNQQKIGKIRLQRGWWLITPAEAYPIWALSHVCLGWSPNIKYSKSIRYGFPKGWIYP